MEPLKDADRRDEVRLTLGAKRALSVAVTISAILLLLLAAEAAVRIRSIIKYGTSAAYEDYYTIDEKLGLRVARSNFSSGHISTNSLGFRGPEIAVPKPPGTLRLAFLGASTTWCAEVSGNEYVWPHLVTASVRRAFPQSRIDYVNAGLSGYTMEAILKNLQYRVMPLAPDVVVIYEAANNFSGEMRDLAAARGIIPESKVHEISWPGHYSLLWYLVEKNLMVLAAQHEARSGQGRLDVDMSHIGEDYRKVLSEIVRTAQQHAKLVVIATFSTQLRRGQDVEQQRHAAASAFFYMPFVTPQLVIEGIERYNQVAREVAAETGAMVIEGANDVPGDGAHYVDTYHFTDKGSRAMARRVSDALIADARFKALVSTETESQAGR